MTERQPKDIKSDIEQESGMDPEEGSLPDATRQEYREQLRHMVERVLEERTNGESPSA